MPLTDAYFFVQEDAPGVDAADVIEILKGRERVGYNIINQVLSYVVSCHALLLALPPRLCLM